MKKLFALFLSGLFSSQAHAFEVDVPVLCTVGQDCFIQNYVDVDPSAEYQDYRCGPLTYDKHKGVDFRLRDFVAMDKGVTIVAAADGIVRAVRDGVPDSDIRKDGGASVKDKECGNGVVLLHEDNWETQYCHVKAGSILVKPGDRIEKGTPLASIGLSGLTEFPHAHFEVRHKGQLVDPFIGETKDMSCKAPRKPLWSTQAQKTLTYISTAVLNAGFTDTTPDQDSIRHGKHRVETLPVTAPALIFWADAFGILKNDTATLRITSPEGEVLAEHSEPYDRSKAQIFIFVGKKLVDGRWRPGEYTGEFFITRDKGNGGEVVVKHISHIKIE